MTKTTVVGVVAMLTLAVALVLGTQVLGVSDAVAQYVTIVLGFIGVTITQVVSGSKAEKTETAVQELNADLHNGTFEKLIREAVMRIAADESTKLNITQEGSDDDGRRQNL